MINFLMQSESGERFTTIKADGGDFILNVGKYFKGFGKIIIPVNDYLCGSFHEHSYIILPDYI